MNVLLIKYKKLSKNLSPELISQIDTLGRMYKFIKIDIRNAERRISMITSLRWSIMS